MRQKFLWLVVSAKEFVCLKCRGVFNIDKCKNVEYISDIKARGDCCSCGEHTQMECLEFAVNFFDSLKEISNALGITQQHVYTYHKRGTIVKNEYFIKRIPKEEDVFEDS